MNTESDLVSLLEPLHQETRAFARRLCRNRADGDDLFHDAVVQASRKLDGLRDHRSFRPWFYQVILSIHRTRSRRPFWKWLVPLLGNEAANDRGPDGEFELRDGAERVRSALATLSAVQREAFVMFELQGFKIAEVAAIQGVSASAVKSRLTRSRNQLRTIYQKRFGPRPERANRELAKGQTT